jgi:hypothetical protein
MYFGYSVVGVTTRILDRTEQNCRSSEHTKKNKYSRNRTSTPPDWFYVGLLVAGSQGWV